MADRIAIIGGEPYAEWIKRDGNVYCDKWPDGTTQCVAIGDEFYVRQDGDGMRRVYNVDDFDDEWCSQCGTPIDTDGGDYYRCDVYECPAVLCENCGDSVTCDRYCPRHRGNELLTDSMAPEYTYPYVFKGGHQFTFGVEIEIESDLSDEFAENVTDSSIIAGWDRDASLEGNGVELQSNILDMSKLPALRRIVEGIPEYGENAGGHIHVARTPNQCASRWYWALRGLMRHLGDDYWCALTHGEYTGKHTAINDEHADTIELRTFDCWYAGTADELVPAVKWIRAMWRFFERHPRGTVSASFIERYASCMADNVTDTPASRSPNDSPTHVESRRHEGPKRSVSVGNALLESVATSKRISWRRVPRVAAMVARSRPRLNIIGMRGVVSVDVSALRNVCRSRNSATCSRLVICVRCTATCVWLQP